MFRLLFCADHEPHTDLHQALLERVATANRELRDITMQLRDDPPEGVDTDMYFQHLHHMQAVPEAEVLWLQGVSDTLTARWGAPTAATRRRMRPKRDPQRSGG